MSLVAGVALITYALAGCGHCPKCPPPTPATIVEVRKPCMEPLPELPSLALPAPNADGSITMPLETARTLFLFLSTLRSYLETQYTRCNATPADTP